MPVSAARWIGLGALAVLAAMGSPTRASEPDEKESCASAFERGQELERAGHLRSAQRTFLRCAAPTCPAVLSPHCVAAAQRVEAQIPSIVIAARGSGGEDLADVRVLVDGEVVAERLDGKAIPIDPGSHRVRFEHRGAPPVEREILIRVGERNRAVDVSFTIPPPPDPLRAPSPPPPAPRRSPLEIPAIVALAAGGAGVVTGGVAGAIALANKLDLDRNCPTKATCDPSRRGQIDAMKTQSTIATAGLAIGAAGLALGAVLFIVAKRPPRAAKTSVFIGPGSMGVRGSF